MQLIGMLDSPYVRRVAVSLKVLGLAFDLDQVSVFRQFEKFSAINPVVKAPSFITDDGVVLMDSGLILEHIAHLAPRSLMPPDRAGHAVALRQIGLALAACAYSAAMMACAAAGFFSLAPLITNRKTSRFFLGAAGAISILALGEAPFSQSLARCAHVFKVAAG